MSRLTQKLGWVGWTIPPLLAALYVAGTQIPGSTLWPWRPGMIDLDVYRRTGQLLLAGQDFFNADGLPWIYPPFAALGASTLHGTQPPDKAGPSPSQAGPPDEAQHHAPPRSPADRIPPRSVPIRGPLPALCSTWIIRCVLSGNGDCSVDANRVW